MARAVVRSLSPAFFHPLLEKSFVIRTHDLILPPTAVGIPFALKPGHSAFATHLVRSGFVTRMFECAVNMTTARLGLFLLHGGPSRIRTEDYSFMRRNL